MSHEESFETRARIELRCFALIGEARRVVGECGERPLRATEIDRLLRAFSIDVVYADLGGLPAILTPPIAGRHWLAVDRITGRRALPFLCLHELAHVMGGDIDEPTIFHHRGPLPESEEVADMFAAAGLIDPAERRAGPQWIERRLLEIAPIEDRGWRTHRVPRLARRLARLGGAMPRNRHELRRWIEHGP